MVVAAFCLNEAIAILEMKAVSDLSISFPVSKRSSVSEHHRKLHETSDV